MAVQSDFKTIYPRDYFPFDTVLVQPDTTQGHLVANGNTDSLLMLTSSSIFENHRLKVKNHDYIPRQDALEVNPFWFLMGGLLILAVINIFYPRFTLNILASGVIKSADKKQVNKEKENTGFLLTQAVNLIYTINFSILIYWTLKFYGIVHFNFSDFVTQLLILGGLFLFSRLKTVAIYIYFILYKYSSTGDQLINLKRASENAIGVLLLALLWFIIYLNNISFAMIAFAIALIISVVRMFFSYRQILSSTGFNHIQIIIYLCTLEILPLIVLFKVIYSSAF